MFSPRVRTAVGAAVVLLVLWPLKVAAAAQQASSNNVDINLYLETENSPFLYGVASADPLEDSVLIWTRIDAASVAVNQSVPVLTAITLHYRVWERDNSLQSFDLPSDSGTVQAFADNDFCVTVDVANLLPSTVYHYQFQDDLSGRKSRLGTTKTISSTSTSVSVAMMSCTSLWSGYFNFYRHLARSSDVDMCLHVGDYIYPQIDPDERVRLPNGLCPEGTTQTPDDNAGPGDLRCAYNSILQEYRWMYQLYHMDPDFREAKANHPFVVQFDNHDLNGRSSNRTESSRRAALEWVPQRVRYQNNDTVIATRNFRLGNDLLDLIVLDTYTYEPDPARNGLLGEGQHLWLDGVLQDSEANNVQWRILASGRPFMPFLLNLVTLNLFKLNYFVSFFGNQSEYWAGQPQSMQRLWNQLETTGTDSNNLWVTGDLHVCVASDVFRYNPKSSDLLWYRPWLPSSKVKRFGGEIQTCSGTRGNLNELIGSYLPYLRPSRHSILGGVANKFLDSLAYLGNRHFRYFNGSDHGYSVATFTPTEVTVNLHFFDILKISDQVRTKTMVMQDGVNRWR
jgi:alkaline phosphatase D